MTAESGILAVLVLAVSLSTWFALQKATAILGAVETAGRTVDDAIRASALQVMGVIVSAERDQERRHADLIAAMAVDNQTPALEAILAALGDMKPRSQTLEPVDGLNVYEQTARRIQIIKRRGDEYVHHCWTAEGSADYHEALRDAQLAIRLPEGNIQVNAEGQCQ